VVIALLLATTSTYILFTPIDPSNFESTTGVEWDGFSAENPEAADYLIREARLLALGFLGLTLLAAMVAWGPLRRGDPWAKRVLWPFPATLLGTALVFLLSGDGVLTGTYLTAGVVSAMALAMAGRRGMSVPPATRKRRAP
jgi:uncharacterized membrane protein